MSVTIELGVRDESATSSLAGALAAQCRTGDCILLTGDLGAGKTSFARAFIRARCGDVEVTSPTFALMQSYDAPDVVLHHLDLYRLTHAHELTELGLEEALQQGICLIEWPQVAMPLLPDSALHISITAGHESSERCFTLKGSDREWKERLMSVEKNI